MRALRSSGPSRANERRVQGCGRDEEGVWAPHSGWWGVHLATELGRRTQSLYSGPRCYSATRKLGLLQHRARGSARASFTWAISTATSADSATLNPHKDQIVFLNLPVMLPVFRFLMVSEKCFMESKWSKPQLVLSLRNRSLQERAQLLPSFLNPSSANREGHWRLRVCVCVCVRERERDRSIDCQLIYIGRKMKGVPEREH